MQGLPGGEQEGTDPHRQRRHVADGIDVRLEDRGDEPGCEDTETGDHEGSPSPKLCDRRATQCREQNGERDEARYTELECYADVGVLRQAPGEGRPSVDEHIRLRPESISRDRT